MKTVKKQTSGKWCVRPCSCGLTPHNQPKALLLPTLRTVRYVLSYGQYGSTRTVYHRTLIEYSPVKLLSIFVIFPTLVSMVEFFHSLNPNLPPSSLLKHGIAAVVKSFFTCKELDPPIWNSRLPFTVISHPSANSLPPNIRFNHLRVGSRASQEARLRKRDGVVGAPIDKI